MFFILLFTYFLSLQNLTNISKRPWTEVLFEMSQNKIHVIIAETFKHSNLIILKLDFGQKDFAIPSAQIM